MRKLVGVLAALVLAPLASGAAPAPRVVLDVANGSSRDVVSFAPDGSDFRDLTQDLPASLRLETEPSWSPDGSSIAWTSHRDSSQASSIYVMNADGTSPTRLTSAPDGVFDQRPCWLPDGRIVWARTDRGSTDLWVMKPDGSAQRRLTTEGGALFALVCSPATREVAYARAGAGAAGQVRVLDVDTDVAAAVANEAQLAQPAWSPDGRWIAFADEHVHIVRPDGTGSRQISTADALGPVSWSPDARTIVATGYRGFPSVDPRWGTGFMTDVVSIDVATGATTRLTGPLDDAVFDARSDSTSPTFWPNGNRIYFVTMRGPGAQGSELWQMNRDGTCETRVIDAWNVSLPKFRLGATPTEGSLQCSDLAVRATISKTLLGLRDVPRLQVTVSNDGNQVAYAALELVSRGGVLDTPHGEGDCSLPEPTMQCALPTIAPGRSYTMTFIVTKLKAGTLIVNVGARADDDRASWNNDTEQSADVKPCYRLGTPGNDNLVGTNGVDRICGLPGWDHIRTLGGNDYIAAGTGADTIDPGAGNDTVIAGGGDDVVYARDRQRDWIDCGTEYDIVYVDRIDHTSHCEKVLRR